MRNSESQIGASRPLYPLIQPYNYSMMTVLGEHVLYVEECGNPNGIPVVVLHGGPGGGCSPGMRRFFNPDIYRVILFDQSVFVLKFVCNLHIHNDKECYGMLELTVVMVWWK